MKYDKRVTLRLSSTELTRLADKANKKGVTLSTYIREKLFKKK